MKNPPLKAGESFFTGDDPSKQEWEVVKVASNADNGF